MSITQHVEITLIQTSFDQWEIMYDAMCDQKKKIPYLHEN